MRLNLAATVMAIISLAGCGSKGGESTVTGIVKYKGTPLITGYVLLQFDDGNSVNGNIAVDGRYSITTPLTGHAKVAVGSSKPVRTPDAGKRGGPSVDLSKIPDPDKWVEIPAKYADPSTSGKEATIKGNDKIDIDLE
jgi:hypothetical protein